MKYENAGEVLPEELLKEIQKYAAGKLLYIPKGEEKKDWGETSGYRDRLQRRNVMIRNKYANGMTVSELADEYFLSLDSIKKSFIRRKMIGISLMLRRYARQYNMRITGCWKNGFSAT
ncbi:CD3324 family protein [Paenibacillus sp. VMFN-D1]|uniref:CD3324 family protein n=1 Tax=Paenibacillus sp. VMFN-D1 TaxID=2135608 RepID=UPI000E36558D|nr:CD3324 family protein [Paenibacillus sp. VMFN-D1]RED39829.1 hypothetical protein C7820_0967 [Paenibacillus sp. VMFN-D1]